MEKKILKILKKVKIDDLVFLDKRKNLVDWGAIVKISANGDQVILIIDVGILGVSLEKAKIIEQRCQDMIKNALKIAVVRVALTSSGRLQQESVNKNENRESQSPHTHKKVNEIGEEILPIIGVKKVIAVASGKGGVGKSTVAVNLALSLKKIGFKVGLVDADIYGPSIPYMMNLQGKPQIENNLMLPINNYGIDCISIGSLIEADQALVWRGPMVAKTLYQLIRGVAWRDIDYLIVDLPPGTGDVHLSMAQKFPLDGAVIVCTPQEVAVIDAVKAIDMFKKLEVPILGVVQNMAYLQDENGAKNYIFGQDGAKRMAQKMGINFLGDIALDVKIREAGDNKNPIVNFAPSSRIALDYGKIAEDIVDWDC